MASSRLRIPIVSASGTITLHEAVTRGNVYKVEALLKGGVDPNTKDNTGRTPLHLSLVWNRSARLFRLLLDHGADYRIKEPNGKNVLHVAVWCGKYRMVRELVEIGVDCNETTDDGYTPLQLLFKHFPDENNVKEMFEILKILLKHGADPGQKDSEGNNVLHLAVRKYGFEIIHELLQHGLNCNDTNSKGQTALHLLFRSLNSRYPDEIISIARLMMVEYNADLDRPDDEGCTPFYYALADYTTNDSVIDYLRNKCANFCGNGRRSILFPVIWRGDAELLSFLLTNGVNLPRVEVEENESALCHLFNDYYGFKHRPVDVLRLLLQHGANVNSRDEQGQTALQVIANLKCEEDCCWVLMKHVALLVEKGSYVHPDNLKAIEMWSQMRYCYAKCQAELVKMKNTRIYKSYEVTYFDVLTMERDSMVRMLRRQNFVLNVFKADYYRDLFEIYGNRIMQQILQICRRLTTIIKCESILVGIFNGVFSQEIICEIVRYYKDDDLEKLLQYGTK